MENKNECELVQDLLLNYIDEVLNDSTKEFVENHLSSCSECKEKFQELKNDITTNENTKKIEIDYLKKYKRNSTIKAILSPILLLIIIFFGIYFYKFSVINSLCNKESKAFSSENFYIESTAVHRDTDISTTKTWYKDGKYKIATYKNNILTEIKYGEINADKHTIIDESSKTAKVIYDYFKMKKSNLFPSSNPMSYNNNLILKLGSPFYFNISKDTEFLGREYYVITSKENKDNNLWIDKENGTIIQKNGFSCSIDYYENTNIVKKINNDVTQNKYSFNTVNDEDVNLPDLSTFTVIEDKESYNYIKDLIEDAINKKK